MSAGPSPVEEARDFGLDVEVERCNIGELRVALNHLRMMTPSERALAVASMNEGWSLTWALRQMRANRPANFAPCGCLAYADGTGEPCAEHHPDACC